MITSEMHITTNLGQSRNKFWGKKSSDFGIFDINGNIYVNITKTVYVSGTVVNLLPVNFEHIFIYIIGSTV